MSREDGYFKKGQSGNPGGRPKVVAEVRDLARQHTADAIETLVTIMSDDAANPSARVAAANSLLDRGYGKAPATMEVKGDFGADFSAFLRSLDDLPEVKATPRPTTTGRCTDANPSGLGRHALERAADFP